MVGFLRLRASLRRCGGFTGVASLLALVACGGGDSDTVAATEKKQALARAGVAVAQQLKQRLAPEDVSNQRGPVDYGRGAPALTGTRELLTGQAGVQAAAAAAAVPAPHITGQFTEAFPWPLIPLHAVLLPDGRVMSYGTNELGDQGGQFNYAVWDPSLGTGTDAHLLLPNTATTDIFCTGQIVVPRTGEVIMTGGDRTINGVRNYSINDVTFFDYLTNKIRASTQKMAQPRWYPTVTTLLDGSVLVLGGRDDIPVTTAIATPELFNPDTGWKSLTGATNDVAYGTANWWYPRAWTAPSGQVFVATDIGRTFMVNTAGAGSITEQSLALPGGDYWFPDVMFAPGRILSVRGSTQVSVINLNGSQPTAAATANLSQMRYWSSATVLADGKVLVSGGSSAENQATGVAYHTEIWNPATGTWTIGASASRMRLYHSTAMLLPDGRVLTAGGGAPGPVTNLNGEIYEPPYLFKTDGSGQYAARPAIQSAPLQIGWGANFNVQTDGSPISKLVFIRTGSVTHSVDFDQRYSELAFTQNGAALTVQAPASAGVAPPGNYLLFAFNSAGVPSVAKIIRVAPVNEVYPNSLTVRARATTAGGIGATMEVRIADVVVGTTQVTNTAYQDFVYPLASVTPGGAKVEIVYTNDGTVGAENRNLFVESLTLNRTTVAAGSAGVVFDRGSGAAAFDNADVVAGTTDLATNGALRFVAPGALSSTVTIRARADIAENVGPILRVLVDGSLAASVEVRNAAFQDYTLRLPMLVNPGARVDLVYANDGSATGDRNLYVESLRVNGSTILATAPSVSVDIGSGAAAFDGVDVIPGQSEIYWNAALRFTAPAATPTLSVRARATLAGNVGPLMQVLVNGASIGSTEVRAAAFTDYSFALAAPVPPSARIDVVFDNDAFIAGEDRNLFIGSLTVGGSTLSPTDPGVTVDIGSGAAAFDGTNTLPGQGEIYWNAALRFTAPNATGPKLTVRAMASLAAGVGPQMDVLVDGVTVGSIEVKATSFTDYVFALAATVNPSARVDVAFRNDGSAGAEDRNLYVESVVVNGATLLPTDPGVTVDIGTGAAAFDGVDVIPGQGNLLWNAALRFFAPNNATPKLTVRAQATLAAGVGPNMQIRVNGTVVGSTEVKALAYTNYVFSLPAAVAPGARVDVVFTNDGGAGTEDRNLFIESVTVNGIAQLATAAGVTVDIGSGAAAFDGVEVIAGQSALYWNAALRLFAP